MNNNTSDYKLYYYGAYGSNLNVGQMRMRCPQARKVGTETLKDWRLVFRQVADVVPSRGSETDLGIWQITDECEKALDHYEGYPHLYTKEFIQIDNKLVMIYRMSSAYPIAPPLQGYLDTIINGFEDFALDRAPLVDALKHSWVRDKIISET